jgi:Flp pilus assembly protein CpaB
MPTVTPPRSTAPGPSGRNGRNPLQTRRGSVVAAGLTALVAEVLLVLYLNHYGSSSDSGMTETVLAARNLLPKGSSGSAIASSGLFQAVNVKHSQVKDGAITDPAALRGQVTTKAIFPGEQITTADLQPRGVNGVVDELTGRERAIAIPIDSARSVGGTIQAGDHVDVYGAFAETAEAGASEGAKVGQRVRELAQNVLILRAPNGGGGGVGNSSGQQNVVLQVSERLAGKLVLTAEYHKVWLTLRPPVGAHEGRRSTDVLSSVLR